MEFADYGVHYAPDHNHQIDLRDPNYGQPTYLPVFQQQPQQMPMHPHPLQHQHPSDFYHNPLHPHYAMNSMAVEVKPRLTKEQHDVLENHYRDQNKPNTQTKKGFAEKLGVSLDKVNNWFQNRRAKTKQDAKKAGQAAAAQPTDQQDSQSTAAAAKPAASDAPAIHTPVNNASNDDLMQEWLNSDFMTSPQNDSAVKLRTSSSNGLGITQVMTDHSHVADYPPSTMAPQDMLHNPILATPPNLKHDVLDLDVNRRTLTQEEFNSLNTDHVANPVDSAVEDSPQQPHNPKEYKEYLPHSEFGDFDFGDMSMNSANINVDSNDMQPEFNTDGLFGLAGSSPDGLASVDAWQNSLPTFDNPDPANSDQNVSPRANAHPAASSDMWTPGSSIPIDAAHLDQQFGEAAARARSQTSSSGRNSRKSSFAHGVRRQISYQSFNGDPSFTHAEVPAGLTESMNDLDVGAVNAVAAAVRNATGSMGTRRRGPRPQPLSLRSASYCGSLPTAPAGMAAIPTGSAAPAGPAVPANGPEPRQVLRRAKSSNVMNGIASGRIQKNFALPQRSPMNANFTQGAQNSPRFARRVSSFSPANALGSLAAVNMVPPTPMSPNEIAQHQRHTSQMLGNHHMSRQPSINELHAEAHMSATSPPPTPSYAAQFVRARMANGLHENTPPQSAPAGQQCFPSNMYAQAQQIQQAAYSQAGMMASMPLAYAPTMANEVVMNDTSIPMANLMQPGQMLHMIQQQQQQQHHQQQQQQQQQQLESSIMLPQTQPLNVHYANMTFNQGMTQQQITPPMQFPFVPVPSSPGHLLGSQQLHHAASKSAPAADFTVHQYSPPQEATNREATPRKGGAESNPKQQRFTFNHQGPEHYEKKKSQKDLSGSPDSVSGASSST